jgi:hypothetical protein
MPKTNKTAINKVAVGTSINKPVVGFVAVIAIFVLGIGGFFGFGVYKAHSLKAKAAGYAKVLDWNGFTASVCKVNSVYGYGLKVIGTKPAGVPNATLRVYTSAVSNFDARQPGSNVASGSWWNNVVTVATVYAGSNSWWYEIKIENPIVTAYAPYGTAPWMPLSMAYTPSC